jgi:AraC-like DNA-binding protein
MRSIDEFATLRFSTQDFPAEQRLALLREMIGRRFLELDVEPISNQPPYAEGALRALPGLRMFSVYTLGLRLERRPEARTDGQDWLCLLLVSAGRARVSGCGQEIVLEHGEATLLAAAEPFALTFPAAARAMIISVPTAALAPRASEIDDALMRPISRDVEALKLLAAYLGFIKYELTLATDDLRHQAAGHVSSLIALAVCPGDAAAEHHRARGVQVARLRAVKGDIIDNLGRSDLSVELMAARHGVTSRHLRRLFATEQTTFSDFVLGQRLARAHRLLSSPNRLNIQISAVAFECGFGDLSYFNRSFRRAYGASPSEVRDVGRREQRREDQREPSSERGAPAC